ncbi:MAG: sulfatase, partial [Opitutae bacterium]|nr:sulfatase [Opitutae bacterium]
MSILRNSLFLLATSLLLAAAVKSSEPEKPNVIVIYVDDVGWVDLESYGSEFYETPNIDSLLS